MHIETLEMACLYPEEPASLAILRRTYPEADLRKGKNASLCNLIEAAQCLWEAYLECKGGDIEIYVAEYGTVRLRHELRDPSILHAICYGIAIGRAAGGDAIAYDWEFVPEFLNRCLQIDIAEGVVSLDPDWPLHCINICKEVS